MVSREQQLSQNFEREHAILKLAQAGDQHALNQIFEQYRPLLKSLANSYFLPGGDRDDLLQEAMIGLFLAIQSFDTKQTHFFAYARLCIRRQLIDCVRQANRNKHKPLNEAVSLEQNISADNQVTAEDYFADKIAQVVPTPVDSLLEKETREQVFAYVEDKLSEQERIVLLSYIAGMDMNTIANQQNLSYRATTSSLQRARQKIAHFLQHLCH